MKLHKFHLIQLIVLLLVYSSVYATPIAGFFLPDSVKEMTVKFRALTNLIILPVTINDSLKVNLILDTGCRNLVLFGKKFEKILSVNKNRPVMFSGLGDGKSVSGHLSLSNKVSINHVLGYNVPVVVVPDKNLFSMYHDVHGVIGYDIFLKFEIEINPQTKEITFRPAAITSAPEGYTQIPLRVVDSRPVLASTILFQNEKETICDLMIDTGSSLGLLLKTTDINQYGHKERRSVIGRGFNGMLMGFEKVVSSLKIKNLEITTVAASIVESPWHNNASIGMDILKDYIVILNYCRSYACLKKLST